MNVNQIKSLQEAKVVAMSLCVAFDIEILNVSSVEHCEQFRLSYQGEVTIANVYCGKAGYKVVMGGKENDAKAFVSHVLTGSYIKSDVEKPCMVCKQNTSVISVLDHGPICSIPCQRTWDKKVDDLAHKKQPRILLVNTIDPFHNQSYGFMVVEQLWDEMAGNYWGAAIGAPSKFHTEHEAQEWINRTLYIEAMTGSDAEIADVPRLNDDVVFAMFRNEPMDSLPVAIIDQMIEYLRYVRSKKVQA